MLDENKQRSKVGLSGYGNCGVRRLGNRLGKLFPIPAQPLIPVSHDPQCRSQAFQRAQLSFPSAADCNGQAQTFLPTSPLNFEGFLTEATAVGKLRRIGEGVKIQDGESLELHFPLFFHKTKG